MEREKYRVGYIDSFVEWVEEAAQFDKRLTALEEQIAGLGNVPLRGTMDYSRTPLTDNAVDAKMLWAELDDIVAKRFKEKRQAYLKDLDEKRKSSEEVLTNRIIFKFLSIDEAISFYHHVEWTIDNVWVYRFINTAEFMETVAGKFTHYVDPVMLKHCMNADPSIGWKTNTTIAYAPYKSEEYYVVHLAYPKKEDC